MNREMAEFHTSLLISEGSQVPDTLFGRKNKTKDLDLWTIKLL